MCLRTLALMLMLMITAPIFLLSSASATIIYADQVTAKVNQVFNVTIICEPDTLIKAYELKIQYDPRILSVTSLSSGDFFKDKPTFSSPNCVINKTTGIITNVYNLILGKETMVNTTGALLYLHCIGLMNGTTNITIYDAGVTNNKEYLPLSVMNGSVTIDGIMYNEPPQDSSPPPAQPTGYTETDDDDNLITSIANTVIVVLIIGLIIVFILTKVFM